MVMTQRRKRILWRRARQSCGSFLSTCQGTLYSGHGFGAKGLRFRFSGVGVSGLETLTAQGLRFRALQLQTLNPNVVEIFLR